MIRRMVPRARVAVAVVATAIVVGVVLVATGVVGVSEKAEGEKASLREFARERAGVHARKLPLAVIREKIEKGKEGGGEIASGPAQQQVDQRAYPRGYVETKRARAARQAYLAAPTRLAASAFGRGAVDGAQRDALAANWTELGPTIPTVPAEVTYYRCADDELGPGDCARD